MMKTTLLLIGHGSRDPEGNQEIEEFARRWREMRPEWTIELCFIEFADVLMEEGLARAAQQSARVIVVPEDRRGHGGRGHHDRRGGRWQDD